MLKYSTTMHPNSTNGMVIIQLESFPISNPIKITLSSLQSATIKGLFDGIWDKPIFMFDGAELPASAYFITVQSTNGIKLYKLIVVN